MKKHAIVFLVAVFLTSCSQNNVSSSEHSSLEALTNAFSSQSNNIESEDSSEDIDKMFNNVGKMLPNVFSDVNFDSEVRRDSYNIIGNGFYDKETSIMNKNTAAVYNYFKNLEISETMENDHTRYGGSITVYTFDNLEMKFWDNYLFLESAEIPYKGDFYKIIGSRTAAEFTEDIFYHSFRIDAGELSIKDSDNSPSSDEIRNALLEMKYMPSNDSVSINVENPLKTVQLNNIDSLFIYSETDFKIFQSDRLFSLNDGYSFASFLSLP